MNEDLQLKIESMTKAMTGREQKGRRNNPPQKETHLKGSKDHNKSIEFVFKRGLFGPQPPKMNLNQKGQMTNMAKQGNATALTAREPERLRPLESYDVQQMYANDDLKMFKSTEVRLK